MNRPAVLGLAVLALAAAAAAQEQPVQPQAPPGPGAQGDGKGEAEGGEAGLLEEGAGEEAGEEAGEDGPINRPYLEALVTRLAREAHAEGLRHQAEGNDPAALTAILEASELLPADPAITADLARAYHRLGNAERAERAYRAALQLDPRLGQALLGLADLLLESRQPGPIEEARRLALQAREVLGNTPAVLVRQARAAAAAGDAHAAERLYLEVVVPGAAGGASDEAADDGPQALANAPGAGDPTWVEASIELGDAYRDAGRTDDALRTYQAAADAGDALALERLRQTEIEAEARRLGVIQRSLEVDGRASRLVERGAALALQGNPVEAEAALREALRLAPGLTAAGLQLGDVLRAGGRAHEAELAYLRSLALDHGSADLHLRLAELYMSGLWVGLGEPPGAAPPEGRAAEAALLLERAVQLAPSHAELELRLAQALRQSGDLPRALRAVDAYLARPDAGAAGRAEAQRLRQSLRELLREPGAPGGAPDVSTDAAGALAGPEAGELRAVYNRVRVLLARSQTGAAMAELHRAAAAEPSAALRNLEARVLRGTGRPAAAIAAFEASLQLEPDQAQVYSELGRLRAELGDAAGAKEDLETAGRLGDAEAAFHLGRLTLQRHALRRWHARLAGAPELLAAAAEVERFAARAPTSIYAADAQGLADELRAAAWPLLGAWAAALLAALLGLGAAGRRALGGHTLLALCDRHPEVVSEVQRILAAIRHEVLKHHTLTLTGVIEGLGGARDVAAPARQAALAIDGPRPGAPGGGAAARLRGYAADLERLARSRGMRLSLGRRDPALAPVLRGFRQLEDITGDLRRVEALGPRRRRRLLARLQRAARLVNVEGYAAVSAFVEHLRVLEVDERLLLDVFERIRREPGLAGLPVASLRLELGAAMPRRVYVGRRDLEDILGNLMRNAIAASARGGPEGDGPIEIGLSVSLEVNEVTGHERVVFGVRDRAPRPLEPPALRGQRGHGLGLASELVARYDGSLQVDAAVDGWAKAVLVKLPCPEQPAAAAAAAAARDERVGVASA